MDMVAHQAVAPKLQLEARSILSQEVEIKQTILSRVKNNLAGVASLRNVMRHSFEDCSGNSWHVCGFPPQAPILERNGV
jgi:hypothetical protein